MKRYMLLLSLIVCFVPAFGAESQKRNLCDQIIDALCCRCVRRPATMGYRSLEFDKDQKKFVIKSYPFTYNDVPWHLVPEGHLFMSPALRKQSNVDENVIMALAIKALEKQRAMQRKKEK